MRRHVHSILASAFLWLLLPLAAFALDGDSGTSPAAAFHPAILGLSLVVSALMHLFFAPATRDLYGWHFWIFPLFTVPAALLCTWSVCVLFGLLRGGWGESGILFQLWVLVAMLYSLVTPVAALLYPMAILNQWLISRITALPASRT